MKGIVLGTVSNGTFTPLHTYIEARPQIRWIRSATNRMSPHRFQLKFSIQRPYHAHHAFHTIYDSDSKELALMIVPRVAPSNLTVCVYVYLWRPNREGLRCQYRSGHVWIPIQDLVQSHKREREYTMTNVYGEKQCILELHEINAPGPHTWRDTRVTPLTGLTIRPTDRFDACGGCTPWNRALAHFRRTHVPFADNQSVLVWQLCCLNYERPDLEEPVPDTYLENAARHAISWMCMTEAEWRSNPLTDKGIEVLAQVCGFHDWTCPYLYDDVGMWRTANSASSTSSPWFASSPTSKPPEAIATTLPRVFN